ncbi:MAG: ImmA/IrrE family metallo-endopeptidase, partial [Solirubrobacteraceae bacterium]|nr:ImmA/IrrE family metallo-endopeptidase [Solirubrobacteraceae bacterium]
GDPYLWFLVNARETAGDRIRLSLAHELGHAVMHRFRPLQDERRAEPEAYAFATALLLPRAEFDHLVPPDLTLGHARDLKRAFGVSVQAIVREAASRHLISQTRYRSLYKQVSARGWRYDEPDTIRIERPELWTRVLDVHRNRHGYTDTQLAEISRVSPSVLAALFPRDFRPNLSIVNGGGPSGGNDPEPDDSDYEPLTLSVWPERSKGSG